MFLKEANLNFFKANSISLFLRLLWLMLVILFGFTVMLTPPLREFSTKGIQIYRFFTGLSGFAVFSLVLFWLSHLNWESATAIWSFRKTFWVSFVATMCVGLFYLIVFWPGTGMYDTLAIVKTPTLQMANQHPWFYVVMTQAVVRIVQFFGGSFEASFAVLAIVQIILIASTYSYCIVWLQKKHLSKKILVPIAVFLIFCPFLDLFMVNIFKDILYNLLLVAWMPLLYDLWESNGSSLRNPSTVIVMTCFIILSLLRNNGFYVSFLILIAVLVCFPKEVYRKVFILFIVLIGTILGSIAFEKAFNITHLFQETIGIPFQQMAGVIKYDGKISDQDKEFINEIVPLDYIKENFYPYNIDRIKWGDIHLNEDFLSHNKEDFFKTWARLLIPNFKLYVNVYLRNTYGFWSLNKANTENPYRSLYVEDFGQWLKDQNISIKTILPTKIQNFIEPILGKAATTFIGEGASYWIFLLIWIVFGLKNGSKSLLVGAPIIANWMTIMIATPVAFQYRYVLGTVIAVPIFFGMLMLSTNKEESTS